MPAKRSATASAKDSNVTVGCLTIRNGIVCRVGPQIYFKADFNINTPPFIDYKWFGNYDMVSRGFRIPPQGNPCFGRVQHIINLLVMILLGYSALNASEPSVIVGQVVGVHDGDSITLVTEAKAEIKIRLEGIDAPELKQPFGQKSKTKLSGMVFGKKVTVVVRGTDRYKRTIGRIASGEIDVSLEMVKLGMAWGYEKYCTESALIDAQAKAKENGLGLWEDKDPIPPWEWRAKKPNSRKEESKQVLILIHPFTQKSRADFVPSNGYMLHSEYGKSKFHRVLIGAGMFDLDCRQFFSAQVRICPWHLAKKKSEAKTRAIAA